MLNKFSFSELKEKFREHMENIYTDDKFDLGVKGLNQQYDALDPINSYRKESNIIRIIHCDKLF